MAHPPLSEVRGAGLREEKIISVSSFISHESIEMMEGTLKMIATCVPRALYSCIEDTHKHRADCTPPSRGQHPGVVCQRALEEITEQPHTVALAFQRGGAWW